MNGNTTYRQSLGAIGGIKGGRWQTTTTPNRGVAMRQHAHAWLGSLLLGVLVTLAMSAAANAKDKIIQVNCDDGKTLTQALHKADPGETIRVTGTCTERVIITTDRLTLDGQGTAVLDGGGGGPVEFSGVVTIDGARGVTLTGLIIQNGPGEGIPGRRGAAFTVQHTTVQNNTGTGIAVDSARAELTDVTMQSNAVGLDVFTGSTAILTGVITATHNGSGIEVNGQSILEIRGAQVQVNNGGSGLIAGSGQVAIFGFTAAQGSTLTADGNDFAGIIIAGPSALIVYGRQFFGSGANIITTTNNGGFGIFLANGGSIQSPFGTGKFVIEHNPTGVNIVDSSVAVIDGGLNVKNNGTGLLANGAGTLTLRASANPSAITGNSTDVDLQFGTRATFDGVTIGTIVCDAPGLSRGSTVCPPSP